ncbi:MAG: deoxyguanosinetriphosphate triphosphohydrolase [Candidatus Omnitrophica bacterium]|nr:deoxyguanosinetriphosphate triphosphohydrolase [Candidatus Omnitrophota bacterium]
MIRKDPESLLATYAARSSQSRGRKYPEPGHSLRNPFQRDRDRIIHSTAFRRLQYKTQVFVNHEGDHYRTRLTHTLETSQIARSIARVLGLHEDLAEAISLAHDIGHGPFGHAGEWALQELMQNKGGFEHNLQSLRIVESLEERYPDFPGLNLCYETLQGLQKHPARQQGLKRLKRFRTLEADLVDLADEIAYASHDLDDGLRSGLLEEAPLADVALWKECEREVLETHSGISGAAKRRQIVRLIIDRLVKDTVENSCRLRKARRIETLEDLQRVQLPVIALSDTLKRQHAELKRFLRKNLYLHYHVVRMTEKGQRFIKSLFRTYMDKPGQLPPEVLNKAEAESLERAVCDYLAGMTDRFAIQEYKRFFEPYE